MSESANNIFNIIAFTWILLIGILFILSYLLYDKNRILKAFGDFFIQFSFIKRTKTILLSYGLLAILIWLLWLINLTIKAKLK